MTDRWLEARVHGMTGDRTLIAVANAPKLDRDKPFLVRIRRPRNPKHHRMYWGMVKSVVDATDRWRTPEHLHRWIKWQLGLYRLTRVDHGKAVVEWDSTDWMSMDQDRFADYFERAVVAICFETGIDPLDIERERTER